MKYAFITFSGLSLPIAYKLQQEGYDVLVGIIEDIKDYVMEEEISKATESAFNKQRRLELFKGILDIRSAEKVIQQLLNVKDSQDWYVFFEENNLYRWADRLKNKGFEGNFPTKEDFMLEIDRDSAKKFVRKHYPKLYTPDVLEFEKTKEAVAFLETSNDLWVLKGKDDAARTFVPDVNDPQLAKGQILEMLINFPEQYEKRGFILELFIPSIIELTPEKLYYDGEPIGTSIDIENKSFGSGNISIQTGCSEDLVFPTLMEDRINKLCFPPIVDEIAKTRKGLFIWDASILINKKDGRIYFGEFCANRPGYNEYFTQIAQAPSVHEYFERMVKKQNPLSIGTVGSSVRIFNLNRNDETEQISADLTVDFKPEIEKDLWLWDVKRNNRGKFVSVGTDWNLAVITGAGKSINEAVNKMYRNVDGFAFIGAYYRSKDDYLSLDYSSSILNRLNYGLERNLYSLPFDVKVGEIK